MTSGDVTRFYLVGNQLSMKSTEVSWFYIVTKSTLYDFKRSY